MNTILLTLIVSLPSWASDMEVIPKRAGTLVLESGEGPNDSIALPRKKSSLTVDGPGSLELTFHGIINQRARRTQGPGAISVLRSGKIFTTVVFGGTVLDARVRGKRAWRLTAPQTVTVKLDPGRNVFEFQPSRSARMGFALHAELSAPKAKPEPAPTSPPPAPTPPTAVEEPPLVGRGFEPDIVTEVSAESVEHVEAGFDILGTRPPSQTVRGKDESGLFLVVTAGASLTLEARGTGVLVFDFHAHRDSAQPSTLEPAVLAVLLDDVLVQTLKVDGPIDESFSADGQTYQLSERAQFQVTVPPGKHSVEVTLSDNALLGGSVKVRFEPADVTTVASDALPSAPEAPPIIEIREPSETDTRLPSSWRGFTIAGGATTTNSSAQVGAAGLADAFLMPGDFDRIFGFGLTSGFAYVQTDETVGDRRAPDEPTRVTLNEQVVPVLADLRLALDFESVVLILGAGGGGMITRAETEALGSTINTGTEWLWAATGHASLLVPAGDGYLGFRAQWIGGPPQDLANLRDYDPGFTLFSLGYTFSNR